MTVGLFLQVLGLVLVLLAGLNFVPHPRVNLGWLGLFLWFLATLLHL